MTIRTSPSKVFPLIHWQRIPALAPKQGVQTIEICDLNPLWGLTIFGGEPGQRVPRPGGSCEDNLADNCESLLVRNSPNNRGNGYH